MQKREYAQMYEMGLGSLVGDFFQNVKDVVGDVARKVAPIAPYVLPFVAPGIGNFVGGGIGNFIGSRLGQAAIGAGIQGLAGRKPVDIAKDLALQVGIAGLRGATIAKPEGSTFGQGFMEGAFDIKPKSDGSGQVTDISSAYEKVKDSRLNPFSEASQFKDNPKFTSDMGLLSSRIEEKYPIIGEELTESDILNNMISRSTLNKQLGIVPEKVERGFLGQYVPAAGAIAGLASLPDVFKKPEELEEEEPLGFQPNEFYYANPSQYQLKDITGPQGYDPNIYLAADGGEVTGFASGSGEEIEHSDGKVREHPKRIGEIAGAGTGTSDDIPAMLSDGEFVMTAQAVRNAGGGSRKAGAKKMYQMMKSLENGGNLSPQSIGMA